MHDCDTKILHPGTIEIYENDNFRESIPATEFPMPFVSMFVIVDGKECVQQIPVEKVYEIYLDSKGNPVEKDFGFKIIIEGCDKDGKMLFHASGINENNR